MKNIDMSFKHLGYIWLAGTFAICLAIGYIFYDFILVPQQERKAQFSNQLQVERSRVAQVEQFALAHPDTQQYLLDLDKEMHRVGNLLPEQANMGEAVAFFERTAEATGVAFGALSTEKVVAKNGWTEIRVVFKALGAYHDLLEYAKRLEAGPRFMAVRAVEFHNRLMLNRDLLDQAAIQELVEKELTSKRGVLLKPVVERGLLAKQNLMVMNVYLIVVSHGQLPDAEKDNGQPTQALPVKS